ncbi:MAG TPA: ABC transporter permease [Vicinamibacteria bacterium]|nr:ABC transporter permease [Vicinamibacteria bacterium]
MSLVRIYRWLLSLYPRKFRDEFEDEMVAFFREQLSEATPRGRAAICSASAKALVDLVGCALAERWEATNRDKRRGGNEMLLGLSAEAKFAIRTLSNRPAVSITAVGILALGLGAVTLVFSVLDAVVLRPLPYVESDRIVTIWNTYDGSPSHSSPPDYVDRRRDHRTLERIAAVAPTSMNLSGEFEPRHVQVAQVTSDFFEVFGVTSLRGAPIRFPDELGGDATHLAILDYGLWQSVFGSGGLVEEVEDRTIELNGARYQVLGVLPPGFDFPRGTEVYIPLVFSPSQLGDDFRGNEYLLNVGRLARNASVDDLSRDMDRIAASVLERVPERRSFLERNGWGARVVPLHEQLIENVRPALVVLAIAVVLVLLVSGANVANLLLASASGRVPELALRSSLGASRSRLVGQLVVESSLLSLAGGVCGLALSSLALSALPSIVPGDVPRLEQASLDMRALVMTAVVTLLVGIVSGLVPAWQAAGGRLHGALRAGSSTKGLRRLRSALVVAEVALALILMTGAGLLVRSFEKLTGLDPGFDPRGRIALRLRLPASQFPEAAERIAFQASLLERLEAIPGVRSAALSDRVPLDGSGWTGTFYPEGHELAPGQPTPGAELNLVSAGYFETLGIPLLAGRDFAETDTASTPRVVILDESTARRFWPGGAVGQYINMNGPRQEPALREVVGVVGHVKSRTLDEAGRMQLYFASNQVGGARVGVTLHLDGSAGPVMTRVREEIARLAPGLPLYGVRTLEDMVSGSLAFREFQLALLSVFAGLALALAAVGLYGVLSYSVSRRRAEIGIRMAMGAHGRGIAALVLREAVALSTFGLMLGSFAALFLARLLESQLYGILPTDAPTFLTVALLLLLIACLAAWLPARRASRLDPVEALRSN